MVNLNNLRGCSRMGGQNFPSTGAHKNLMQIIDEILNKGSLTIPAEKVRKEIVKSFKESENEGVEMSFFRVSLIDPISKLRIKIPAQSTKCDHFRCFDLYHFLEFSFGKGGCAEEGGKSAWRCPHCLVDARQEQLRVDGYFQEMLLKMGPEPQEVEIFPDGQWKAVEQIDFKEVFPPDKDGDVVEIVPMKKPRILEEREFGKVSDEAATSPRQPEAIQQQCGLCEELQQILGVARDENLSENVLKLKQDSDFVEFLCELIGIPKNYAKKYATIIELFKELLMNQKTGEEKADKASQTLPLEVLKKGESKEDGELSDENLILKNERRENSFHQSSGNVVPSNNPHRLEIIGQRQLPWTREDFENPANWTKARSKSTGFDYYFNAATKHSLFEADIPLGLLTRILEKEKAKKAQIDVPHFSSTKQKRPGKMKKKFAPVPKKHRFSSKFSTTRFRRFQQQKAKNNAAKEEEDGNSSDDEVENFSCEEVPNETKETTIALSSNNDFQPNTDGGELSPFQLRLADFEKRVNEGKAIDKPDALKIISVEGTGNKRWIRITWPTSSVSPFKSNAQLAREEIQLLLWECFSVVANLDDMNFRSDKVRVSFATAEDAKKVVNGLDGLTYFGCKLAVVKIVRKTGKNVPEKSIVPLTLLPWVPRKQDVGGGRSQTQTSSFAAKRDFWPPPRFFAAPPPSSAASSSYNVRLQKIGFFTTPNSKNWLGQGPTGVPQRFSFFGGPQQQQHQWKWPSPPGVLPTSSSGIKGVAVPHPPFESGAGFFNTPPTGVVNLTMTHHNHSQKKLQEQRTPPLIEGPPPPPPPPPQGPSQHSGSHLSAVSSSSFSFWGPATVTFSAAIEKENV